MRFYLFVQRAPLYNPLSPLYTHRRARSSWSGYIATRYVASSSYILIRSPRSLNLCTLSPTISPLFSSFRARIACNPLVLALTTRDTAMVYVRTSLWPSFLFRLFLSLSFLNYGSLISLHEITFWTFVKNKFLSLSIIFSVFLDLLTYRWMFDNFVFRFFINHFFKSKLKNFHYWNQSDSSKRIETWEKFLRVFDIKDIFKRRNSRISVRRIVYTPLYHES